MSEPSYSYYGEWKGWSKQKFGQCDTASARYFAAEMSSAGLWPISGRRLLEIGFGNGEFAQWSSQQGALYSGTEMLDELVSAGCAAGYRMYPSKSDLAQVLGSNFLDGVVAFDVFEHLDLDELHHSLRCMNAYLKPGGLIVGRVPSGDSPFARAIQHGDLTHKTILGSSAIRQISVRCGFEVLQVREPAFPISGQGFTSFLRRGVVKLARSIAFPLLRSIFLGNAQAVLTPNMVFVLRKPV